MDNIAKISDLGTVFQKVVQSFLAFAGIILFVLLLVGGFKYITSGGDPKAIEGAQKTITSALTGLFVVLIAYLILIFIKEITGVDVTKFSPVLQ
jgi:TRAP-type C4-dicarboxylate transport system permease small subunit